MRRDVLSICLASCLVAMTAACSGLRSDQLALVDQWQTRAAALGHPEVRYEELKNPTAAGWLGVLPGVGGFYVHRGGLGTAGLLTWPLSICWEPPLAYSSAHQYNFWKFRDRVIDVDIAEAKKAEHEVELAVLRGEQSRDVYLVRREQLQRCVRELEAERGRRRAEERPGAIDMMCLEPLGGEAR